MLFKHPTWEPEHILELLDLVDKPVYYGVSWAMHPTSSDNTELSFETDLMIHNTH